MFGSSKQAVGRMSYVRYLCLLAYSDFQRILIIWVTYWVSGFTPVFRGGTCCSSFSVFVMCLVYPMLPVTLDFPLLVDTFVFYNVYLHAVKYLRILYNIWYSWSNNLDGLLYSNKKTTDINLNDCITLQLYL